MNDPRIEKLDILMHEWHEYQQMSLNDRETMNRDGRYSGCYGLADFVLKYEWEWNGLEEQ